MVFIDTDFIAYFQAEHIRLGNVTVNGEKVAADFVLDNNMKIDYYIHR